MKIKLRPSRPEDFETLYAIDQACYTPDIAYSREELREYLRLSGAECTVAEARDTKTLRNRRAASGDFRPKLIGFCVTTHAGSRGHIITMDVLEAYRRQGAGSALLREAERRLALRGVHVVGLETATDNKSAIAFWQKHGYLKRGIRKGYYPGGRDASAWTKILTLIA